MARLASNDVANIEALIKRWSSPKISWVLLVAACENELGIKTTRQALERREHLKSLFNQRKQELKAPSRAVGYVKDLAVANDRIQRLEQRNAELERGIEVALEKLTRWQFNAALYGVEVHKLEASLPAGRR